MFPEEDQDRRITKSTRVHERVTGTFKGKIGVLLINVYRVVEGTAQGELYAVAVNGMAYWVISGSKEEGYILGDLV